MIANQGIQLLAEDLAELDPSERSPFVLLLGSDFARAAGVRGVGDLAKQTLRDLFAADSSVVTPYLAEDDWLLLRAGKGDPDLLLAAFFRLLQDDMSSLERHSLLREFYRQVEIPDPYRDLAVLLRERRLGMVVTASVDVLLEESVRTAGLEPTEDFQVIDPLIYPRSRPVSSVSGRHLLPIVKQYGQLTSPEALRVLDEAGEGLGPVRRLVVVSYAFEDEPINDWLSRPADHVWWVSTERPSPDSMASLEGAWQATDYVDGEGADPGRFFAELAKQVSLAPRARALTADLEQRAPIPDKSTYRSPRVLATAAPAVEQALPQISTPSKMPSKPPPTSAAPLPRAPDIKSAPSSRQPLQPTVEKLASSEPQTAFQALPRARAKIEPAPDARPRPVDAIELPRSTPPTTAPQRYTARADLGDRVPEQIKDLQLDEIRLRQQLQERQSILVSLEERALGSERWNARLQDEIAHVRDEMAQLQRALTGLPSYRRRVLNLMQRIQTAAEDAGVGPGASAFLGAQVTIVEKEYEREETDEDVIAAAIAGVVLLAGRLGERVIAEQVTRELASLMPTALGRRS